MGNVLDWRCLQVSLRRIGTQAQEVEDVGKGSLSVARAKSDCGDGSWAAKLFGAPEFDS